jgi:hypothetical protein
LQISDEKYREDHLGSDKKKIDSLYSALSTFRDFEVRGRERCGIILG